MKIVFAARCAGRSRTESTSSCRVERRAKARRSLGKNTSASSRSRSKRPRAKFLSWAAPAATTPQKSSSSRKRCKTLGADGILSVTPYYNKPTQEGLYLHYKAIAAAIKLPIIVYSVAGRTGVNVEPSTLKRLTEFKNIVAVKEASGSLAQMTRIRDLTPDLTLLSGDDILTSAVLGIGGRGIISVASNVVPEGDEPPCRDESSSRSPRGSRHLMDVLFLESNPIPVKAAMAMMGLCEPVWRLPMCAPQPATEAKAPSGAGRVGTRECLINKSKKSSITNRPSTPKSTSASSMNSKRR